MSNFKIGVMTDSFKLPFEEGLAKAAEVGAQGIQLYVVEGEMSYKTFDDAKIKAVNDALAAHNLVVSAVCADFYGFIKGFEKGFLEGIGHYADRKSFFHNYLSFQLLSWRDLNVSIVFSIAARVPGSAFS